MAYLLLLIALLFPASSFAYGVSTSQTVTKACVRMQVPYGDSSVPSWGSCVTTLSAAASMDIGFVRGKLQQNASNQTYSSAGWTPQPGLGPWAGYWRFTCSWNTNRTDPCPDSTVSGTYGAVNVQILECGPNAVDDGHGGCYCKAGFQVNGGNCAVQPDCPIAGSQVAPADTVFPTLAGSPGGATACLDGCMVQGAMAGTDKQGGGLIWGPLVTTGSQCNPSQQGGALAGLGAAAPPSTPASAPAPCPTGQQVIGQVNGTDTCGVFPTTSTSELKPSNDGSGGGTLSKTTCVGGVCTTTEQKVDSKGNPTGPASVVSVGSGGTNPNKDPSKPSSGEEQTDFCAKHPTSMLCTTSSIGGACAAVVCSGDAVQCAIAKEQAKRNCELFEAKSPLSDLGIASADGQAVPSGHPGAAPDQRDISFASTIDTSDRLGGSCPGDHVLSTSVGSVTIPLSKLCGSLQLVGQLVVAFGALLSAFIVFRS